ncbi:uncharacterized protein LOC142240084 [Haematobia irritans]|uniref:uncharacterized protein LOC142240084 n=1 Tax=Haematobia irritans TaxID=7368 RepID=UPI003F4F86A5
MKQILFIGLTILAVTSARVAREAPKAEEESLKDKVETGLKEVDKVVQDLTGANAEQHLENFVNAFHTWTDKFKEESKNLQELQVVKDFRSTVDHHLSELKQTMDSRVSKFKEDQPDTYNKISQHVDSVKSTSAAIVAKLEEFADSEDAKKLKESSLKMLEELKNTLLPEAKKSE